jgi:putative integral membrane protein (TIGR02587 family)
MTGGGTSFKVHLVARGFVATKTATIVEGLDSAEPSGAGLADLTSFQRSSSYWRSVLSQIEFSYVPIRMSRRRNKSGGRTVRQSLEEYGRGIAGGLLFSLPLLYTMEVWRAGFATDPEVLLAYLGLTLVLLLAYNRYAGLRRDASWTEVAIDSVEEAGIGFVLSAVILYLLGQIDATMPWSEMLGKVIVESMTVAIGISVGTAQLGGESKDVGTSDNVGGHDEPDNPDTVAQLVLAFCGAILFAGNIAPTDEVVVIAVETSTVRLIGLLVLSLFISGVIMYYSGFIGADRYIRGKGMLFILGGTMACYATALAASALMLWFTHGFRGESMLMGVSQIIVLGFPASLGASAGRLLIQ